MDNTLNLLNTFFAEQGNTTLVQPFAILEKNFVGKISITTSKSVLDFDVKVPFFFPFSDFNSFAMKFKCKELEGYTQTKMVLFSYLRKMLNLPYEITRRRI